MLAFERVPLDEEKLSYLESWYPVRSSNTSENNIAGEFSQDIADGPGGLHIVELVAVEIEVLLPML